MVVNFPILTTQSSEGFDARNLPTKLQPVATDLVMVIAANGTFLVPLSAFGGSLAPMDGSPEGSVSASPGTTIWDSTNKILYVKETGTAETGWVSTT